MKRSSIFYAILFLLISPLAVFAVDINLKESPTGDDKAVSVEIDTKGEKVNSFKITVRVSENVNISKVEEGEYPCGTFSSTQNGTTLEITCTTKEEDEINASVAKINFTADSNDYSFTVLGDESQIGELNIDSTADIGPAVQKVNNEVPEPPTTTQQTAPTPTSKKEKKLTDYLPYALLGIAGVLLLSIIALLATKSKKDSSTTPTTAHITQPPIPTETEEQKEEKPTLQEMVNAGAGEIIEEPTPTTPVGDHDKDLEALLMSETPRTETTITPPLETATELPSTDSSTMSAETSVADIPFTNPLETSVDAIQSADSFATPVETPVAEVPAVDPLAMPIEAPVAEVSTPTIEQSTMPAETPVADIPLTNPLETSVDATQSADSFSTPVETPVVEVSTVDPLAMPTETPVAEVPPVETLVTPSVDDNQAYVANTSQGGLPSIGFTSPTQPSTDMSMDTPQTSPANNYSDIYGTPTETTSEGVNTNFPTQSEIEVSPNQEAMDLQALVSNEVNNIPTVQPPVVEETTTTTE